MIDERPADGEPGAGTTGDMALLPPTSRRTDTVARQLATPRAGLPAAAPATPTPYSPDLALIGISQSVGGATAGTFGTYISGGVSFLFSDMLGEHIVPVALDVNGTFRDIGAQASYINRTSRWNWGVFAGHVPTRSGYVSTGFDTIDGQDVYVEETELWRETTTQLGALLAYPFSRSTRVEFSASGSRIGFSRERQTFNFDANTGQFLFDTTEDLEGLPALRLAEVGISFVRDRAAFGAVGPVLGQRFRMEVAPTFGDLSMTTATVDFRQYVMPFRPVTFAVRALHMGRYGTDSEDPRLFPLFIGSSQLVRGYDVDSFDANECTLTFDASCPEFDRLVGSRIAVINGEVRVPAAGLLTGNLDYGPIPVELFGFFDAGMAWNSTSRPTTIGTRSWISSAGLGARVNVFGYAVAEFNVARALDRADRGWSFVFNLRPGF